MHEYDSLSRDELIRLLRQSDVARQGANAHDQALREGGEGLKPLADLDAMTRLHELGTSLVRDASPRACRAIRPWWRETGIDGYEVARRMRAQHPRHDVLLIAVTGWSDEGTCERVLAAGFDHHLVKPASTESLEALLMR